jgi:autotransporter-associated beta strand protein
MRKNSIFSPQGLRSCAFLGRILAAPVSLGLAANYMKNRLQNDMGSRSFLRSHRSTNLIAAAAMAVGSWSMGSALAASATWNMNADGSWVTDGNWSPAAAPGATSGTTNTDTATFGTVITAPRIITLDANRNIFGIDFAGNSSAYTLSGGNLLLTNGGVIQSSGAGTAHTDTISSAIAIQGDGGAATFTAGSTTNKRLNIGDVSGVSTAGNVTSLTLNGTGTGTGTTLTTLNAVTGVISDGSGGGKLSLTKSGTGTWQLAGANTYSGGTTISEGTLRLMAPVVTLSSAVGSGPVSIGSGATLALAATSGAGVGAFANPITGAGNVSITTSGITSNLTSVLLNPTFSGNLTIGNSASNRGTDLILANFVDQTIAGTLSTSAAAGTSGDGLRKTGTGTLTFSGTYSQGARAFSFRTYGGEVVLDYTTNNTQKLSSNSGTGATAQGLYLGGGTLTLKGGTFAESVSNVTLNASGATTIRRTDGSTGTLQFGNITRNTGTAVNIGSGIARTLTRNFDSAGILGGYAVVDGTDWAVSGAAQVPGVGWDSSTGFITLPSGSATNGTQVSFTTTFGGVTGNRTYYVVNASGANFQVSTTPGGAPITLTSGSGTVIANQSGAITALASYDSFTTSGTGGNELLDNGGVISGASAKNTLKVTTSAPGQSLDLAGQTLTLGTNVAGSVGGLLFTGSHDYEIADTTTGGSLQLAAVNNGDGVIQQWGGGTLTVSAVIANSVGANTLTKTVPGTLVLSGANTYTGQTYIGQGILSISANNNLGLDTDAGIAVNINGGTLQATGNGSFLLSGGAAGTRDRAIVLGGGGGTLDIEGTTSLQVNGVVSDATISVGSGSGNVNTGVIGSLTKAGSGTLILSGANTYTGPTRIGDGSLVLASTGSLASTSISIGNGAIFDVSAKSGAYSLSGINLAIDTDGITAGRIDAGAFTMTLGGSLIVDFNTILLADGSVDFYTSAGIGGSFAGVALTGSYIASLNQSGNLWTSAGFVNGYSFSFDQSTGVLSFAAIPEPSTYAFGISGMLVLMAAARRRRRMRS